jgi:hypothetical protein
MSQSEFEKLLILTKRVIKIELLLIIGLKNV